MILIVKRCGVAGSVPRSGKVNNCEQRNVDIRNNVQQYYINVSRLMQQQAGARHRIKVT